MIGIGGSGMSGIAEVLLNLGYTVTGSDMSEGKTVQRLKSLGAEIFLGHAEENLKTPQVVVRSTAIKDDNPEITAARKRNIPVIARAEMLAELMRLRYGIAIAGTHGKTTTTSLTASIFDAAEQDATVIIGGLLNAYGTNARLGKGKYLIAEADESDGSFLYLFPIINVVTNVDYDHIDHYGTQENIDKSFISFMNKVPFYGVNIVCGDDEGIQRILHHIKRPVLTYGFGENNTLRAEIIDTNKTNHFNVYKKIHKENAQTEEIFWAEVTLNHPGKHNILNALAAIGVSMEAGIEKEAILKGLKEFTGVGRRFELKGQAKNITVIDDYGHHPTEIKMTVRCAKQAYPGKRIIMAFQPHRFSRTEALFGDFCSCFEGVDRLYLTEIYAASEKPIPGINSTSLAHGIRQVCPNLSVQTFSNIDELNEALCNDLQENDLVITQGAGNITNLGPKVLAYLTK